METKDKKDTYVTPVIEIVEVETEGVIAASIYVDTSGDYDGPAGARKRDFWD